MKKLYIAIAYNVTRTELWRKYFDNEEECDDFVRMIGGVTQPNQVRNGQQYHSCSVSVAEDGIIVAATIKIKFVTKR